MHIVISFRLSTSPSWTSATSTSRISTAVHLSRGTHKVKKILRPCLKFWSCYICIQVAGFHLLKHLSICHLMLLLTSHST